MKRMLTLAVGGAIGYVLGAKAGRERYEQIVQKWEAMRGSGDGNAAATLRERASAVTEGARGKAHDTIDLIDSKVDEAADKAQETADKAQAKAPSTGSNAPTSAGGPTTGPSA